jgi:hypothetical protein
MKRQKKNSQEMQTVVEIVAVKASKSHKDQQGTAWAR